MMPPMKYMAFAFLMIFALSGCGGGTSAPSSGLTPFPSDNGPGDEKLIEAVTAYVKSVNAPPNSDYDFVRVDLNNDGKRDAIVLFKLPHTHWCGWDGCGMAIFKASAKKFTPLSTVSNVRGPIFVSKTGNSAWRDIIIRVSGANMPDKNVILKNNGSGYPSSPLLAETHYIPVTSTNSDKFFR